MRGIEVFRTRHLETQVGAREDGSPEPVFEEQVRRAFANLKAVLAAAGGSFDDVIDVTTFHADPEKQLEAVLKVKDEEIGEALDCGRGQLARGPRLRDQGGRADPAVSASGQRRRLVRHHSNWLDGPLALGP